MPSLETPPNSAPPGTPVKVRTGRFGELEEHELIHLLDSLDDERSKARFRESIYISIIFYLALGWFLFYGPRVLFHQPRLINPADVLKQHDREMTYLDMPKDISKNLPRKPTNVISDKDRTQQTAKPTLDKKTLEQLQAMRKAGTPAPASPSPTAKAAPAPAPQQQAPPQQQQQPQQPLPPAPPQQAMVDAPRPAPTKPNFGNQSQSAGSAIRQAAQGAAQSRGQGGGNFGASLPASHGGMNTGVEVLSDTQGVDFGPYIRRILSDIQRNWEPLIPEEARPPLNKQGETLIRFTIGSNGRIVAMNLDNSTHDDAINKACWSAITSEGQFPPLPKEFKGPVLELRLLFLTNKPLP
ncbi:MAG: energy transducer TonB [Acidobacteriaceae bacterium]|nr:energy transducer TonB [Acidobacteriaceae bacterium]